MLLSFAWGLPLTVTSRSPIRRNKHGMRVATRPDLLYDLSRREIDLGNDPSPPTET